MLAFNVQKKRFNLLYLEENELYVQDLTGVCSFPDISNNTRKSERGKIHICSRSIIFEANNANIPLYKFLFKDMTKDPKRSLELFREQHQENSLQKLFDKKHTSENDEIVFEVCKIVEILTTGPPSPYLVHEVKKGQITIAPTFENIEKLIEKITKLIAYSRTSTLQIDPQEELNKLILEDSKVKFNMSSLESINERPLLKSQMLAKRILPLVSIHGIFYITNMNIYFQTLHSVGAKPVKIIHVNSIQKIFRRRYELRQIGLEIYTKKKSYYFTFENNEAREVVYNTLVGIPGKEFDSEMKIEQMTEKWQKEEISNYEYLMFLNEAADRTFSDLTQYPVFPWVIKDYESTTIDLNNKDTYRDLSKPIGALNPERLDYLLKRYKSMAEPKFLYGTHYSAPGYVIGYLVRKHPQYMLKLQSGKYDRPDRLFWSMKKDWNNVINNFAITKELIPEFYGEDESFLRNDMKLDLGLRQNGKREVKLPKWASDTGEFLKINRAALESRYVSDNLQHWIDLIFGYKQRGSEAIANHNVFHYLTYEGAVDLDTISDPMERMAIALQINEFGQTPRQLFKAPHPPRYDFRSKLLTIPRKSSAKLRSDDLDDSKFDSKDAPDYDFTEEAKEEMRSLKQNSQVLADQLKLSPSRKLRHSEGEYLLWDATGLEKLRTEQAQKVHKSEISAIIELGDNRVLSIGYDGFVKITQLKDMTISRSFKVCDLTLSSVVELKENELYALGSWDNHVYIFNLNYGTRVFGEELHTDAVSQVAFNAQKSTFFTSSWDCSVRSWAYKSGQIDNSAEEMLAEMNCQISKMTLSDDGDLLVFGDVEGGIHLLDLKNHQITMTCSIENEKITALRFLENSQIVAAGETCVKMFDFSGNEYISMSIDSNLGTIVDMDVDGANFIIATDKGNASVFDIANQKRIGAFCNKNGEDDGDVSQEYEFTCMKVLKSGKGVVFGSKAGALTYVSYPE